MNDVSIRIKNARKERKLTQEELGKLLFVSDKTISSWESGRTIPDIESINKISKVLDISFLSLLYGDINLNNIEIEVKFKVSKLEYNQLLHYIDKESIKISEEIQNDYYYVSEGDMLLPLRVNNKIRDYYVSSCKTPVKDMSNMKKK